MLARALILLGGPRRTGEEEGRKGRGMLDMSVNIGRLGAKLAIAGASKAAISASAVIVATGVGVGVALAGYGVYRYFASRPRLVPAPVVSLRAVDPRRRLPSGD